MSPHGRPKGESLRPPAEGAPVSRPDLATVLQTPLLLCGAALLVAGCASTSPEWDSRFGDAVRVLNAQQTLDPAAARRNAGTPTRSDGRIVKGSVDQYVESYRLPAPSSVVGDAAAAR